ncbi:MAG: class I SAM-dependent methyltransferase [Nitrospiraceae bacterium]
MVWSIVRAGIARCRRLAVWPPIGRVRFGSLQRTTPISRVFGLDRSKRERCLDIVFIERFLHRHRTDIRGHVLEIGDDRYTRAFGGSAVVQGDVLHVQSGYAGVTIVADLTRADHLPSETFDCIICTQTLQFIYDVHAAVKTLYRLLRPGGVLLMSGTGISQISRYDMNRWGDYWRFTTASARRLLEECWPSKNVEVQAYGNVLLAIAYLHGLTLDEIDPACLDQQDEDYQMVITARAFKPDGAGTEEAGHL